jgi:hypothetical protein
MKRTTTQERLLLDSKPLVLKTRDKVRMRMSPAKSADSANSQKSYLLTADLFLLFADSTALMIWKAVRRKEMSSPAIAKKLPVASRLVLKTLKKLEQKGLLVSNTRSRTTLYRVADLNMAKAFNTILELPEKIRKRSGSRGKAQRQSRQNGQKRGTRIITKTKTITAMNVPTLAKSLKRYPPGPITKTFTGWLTGLKKPEEEPKTTVIIRG